MAIFVKKLGPEVIDDNALAAIFRHIGPIEKVRLQVAHSGKPKGWGVVSFRDAQHARLAVDLMNGQHLPGATSPLEVHFDRKR
jgi:RNA recognition motif-containing protein